MATQTIIHISDLHIGRGDKETRRTKKIIGYIAASYPGLPVMITGDLTDSATRGQFKEARKLLNILAATNPILTVPGNHDYAWKGNILRPDGWEKWVRYHGSPLGWGVTIPHWMDVNQEPVGIDGLGVWKKGPIVYFGVDSGDPDDKEVSARGYISKKLARALQASLIQYQGKTRIVLIHHHPFSEGYFTKLDGSARLMKALTNNCELLLFGHKHDYGIWWGTRGIPLIVSSHKSTNTPSGDHLMITVIDIHGPGTPNVSFDHRIEVI